MRRVGSSAGVLCAREGDVAAIGAGQPPRLIPVRTLMPRFVQLDFALRAHPRLERLPLNRSLCFVAPQAIFGVGNLLGLSGDVGGSPISFRSQALFSAPGGVDMVVPATYSFPNT